MSIGFIFWLLMLLWLIFGFVFATPVQTSVGTFTMPSWGGHLFLWVLLALLGWGVFGFPHPRMNININVTLDLSSSLKDWIMSQISDAIARVNAAADAAISRVQADVNTLTKAIADLQAKVDAGGDPADIQALADLQAKLDAIDPTKEETLHT